MIATHTMTRSQLVQATYLAMEWAAVDPTSPLGQEVLQTALTASEITPTSWKDCLVGLTGRRTSGRAALIGGSWMILGICFVKAVWEVTGTSDRDRSYGVPGPRLLIVEDEPMVIPEVIPEGELEVVA